ncbi:hypothetical protein HHX47_DHR3000053 [Lentinula edodes]|nr:hypothetical protein HHX47_DHR3000053 [Lentinula edodes]
MLVIDQSFYQHSTTFSNTPSIKFANHLKPSPLHWTTEKCCITHANLVAPVGAVYTLRGHHLTYDDAYLAHVLERIVELIMPSIGMTSGYGRVKTLTDAPVATFQPSIVFVPAIWEMIWKGIVAHVNVGALV